MTVRPTLTAPKVVGIGGGTGLPVTLRALRFALGSAPYRVLTTEQIVAAVAVTDDGGSSGRLRAMYSVLPLGDIRNCLLALADGDDRLRAIFAFRFAGESDVGGHSLGNLMLTALALDSHDPCEAIAVAGRLLQVQGRVYPCTLEPVVLQATFGDGACVQGESQIPARRGTIRTVSLAPATPRAVPEVIDAIVQADLVVIGPGSLYTSVLPVLLVPEIGQALATTKARVVLVANLMTEPGETDGMRASDMVRVLREHVPSVRIDDVLLNTAPIRTPALTRYREMDTYPIEIDAGRVRALDCRPVLAPLVAKGKLVRHDPRALGHALLRLYVLS